LAGGCGLDSTGSGYGPLANCRECDDEPSGSFVTELAGVSNSMSAKDDHAMRCLSTGVPMWVRLLVCG
jgi:hypothetical protein